MQVGENYMQVIPVPLHVRQYQWDSGFRVQEVLENEKFGIRDSGFRIQQVLVNEQFGIRDSGFRIQQILVHEQFGIQFGIQLVLCMKILGFRIQDSGFSQFLCMKNLGFGIQDSASCA